MLEDYNFPADLKNMSPRQLELLAYDIRDFLLDKVSKTGGHIASNLGVVELTIALHKVFDSPEDKIIWDVGHQAYVHKILTGRADRFDTLRQTDGLSGFPKRCESPHDSFDTGHSSTSISAAAGFAAARDLQSKDFNIIAVIGDGALTGGLAYEALNNIGATDTKMLVILNDNEMSITQNTGGMAEHLTKLRMSPAYSGFKKQVKKGLSKIPGSVGSKLYTGMENLKNSVKYVVVEGALFEELGFKYLGPIDGHDIEALCEALEFSKQISGPVFLHVITKKGKGYRNAEQHPEKFHGVGAFDVSTGMPLKKSSAPSYSEVFGNKLIELAKKDSRIVAVSAAMIDGTGLENFNKVFGDRCFDVGIAEAHAVTFSAGLAQMGMKPVVAIYSTFLQRAYDQLMIDVCMQNLPVVFALDRAGNVGADGETHHGIFDLSYLSSMPNMTVLAPKDAKELEAMLEYALSLGSPCAIRYPRGTAKDLSSWAGNYDIGSGCEQIASGEDVEIWAIGKMVEKAYEAKIILEGKGYRTGLVNARFAKPLDKEILQASAKRAKNIVTIEDNIVPGGFGSNVTMLLNELCAEGNCARILNLGWPCKFIEQGDTEVIFERYGLDSVSIAERICDFIEGKA